LSKNKLAEVAQKFLDVLDGDHSLTQREEAKADLVAELPDVEPEPVPEAPVVETKDTGKKADSA
jgi:hypothetical protein